MLTVREAAKILRRHPATIRRWAGTGRILARRVGNRYELDEFDVAALSEESDMLPLPDEWKLTSTGRPQPDWVKIIRRSRQSH